MTTDIEVKRKAAETMSLLKDCLKGTDPLVVNLESGDLVEVFEPFVREEKPLADINLAFYRFFLLVDQKVARVARGRRPSVKDQSIDDRIPRGELW